MAKFKQGDWVEVHGSVTFSHQNGELARVHVVHDDDPAWYEIVFVSMMGLPGKTVVGEALLTSGTEHYEALRTNADVMGIPENLKLAQYILGLEQHIRMLERKLQS